MSYIQVITTPLTTSTNDPSLDYHPSTISVGSSVLVVSRWLWLGNRTFLEVVSMVVTWWILAFLRSETYSIILCASADGVTVDASLSLCALIHLVSIRTFGVMYDHTLFLCLQITRADIRAAIKNDAKLLVGYLHFNLSHGFVWACTRLAYSLYQPKGTYTKCEPITNWIHVVHLWKPFVTLQTQSLTMGDYISSIVRRNCCVPWAKRVITYHEKRSLYDSHIPLG